MAADQGPVVLSALLRSELVRLRKERELTQEQVAVGLEWSPSKLIRVEGGRSGITKVDLDALMDQYGVSVAADRERLQALNRGTRERAFWDAYREEFPADYLNFVGYEAGASSIRQFQGTVIPGLLQTRGYAEELTDASVDKPSDPTAVVKLRLIRQGALAKRTPPPRQYFVLDEAVLRRHVGIRNDPAIMPDQLRQIAAKAQSDEQITVQVIPFSAGTHHGLTGPFTLLEFDGPLPDILYFDTGREVSMTGDDGRVAEYKNAFRELADSALPADESVEFIERVAEEMS